MEDRRWEAQEDITKRMERRAQTGLRIKELQAEKERQLKEKLNRDRYKKRVTKIMRKRRFSLGRTSTDQNGDHEDETWTPGPKPKHLGFKKKLYNKRSTINWDEEFFRQLSDDNDIAQPKPASKWQPQSWLELDTMLTINDRNKFFRGANEADLLESASKAELIRLLKKDRKSETKDPDHVPKKRGRPKLPDGMKKTVKIKLNKCNTKIRKLTLIKKMQKLKRNAKRIIEIYDNESSEMHELVSQEIGIHDTLNIENSFQQTRPISNKSLEEKWPTLSKLKRRILQFKERKGERNHKHEYAKLIRSNKMKLAHEHQPNDDASQQQSSSLDDTNNSDKENKSFQLTDDLNINTTSVNAGRNLLDETVSDDMEGSPFVIEVLTNGEFNVNMVPSSPEKTPFKSVITEKESTSDEEDLSDRVVSATRSSRRVSHGRASERASLRKAMLDM